MSMALDFFSLMLRLTSPMDVEFLTLMWLGVGGGSFK